MIGRNVVFKALFDLTERMAWGKNVKFVTRSRRFAHFDKVPADRQPAFFQTEHTEIITVTRGNPWKQVWAASWTVYLSNGVDTNAVPTEAVNDILDAFFALLQPDEVTGRFDLGGMVYDVYVEGEIIKIPGDDNGQGLIVVPIKLLIP